MFGTSSFQHGNMIAHLPLWPAHLLPQPSEHNPTLSPASKSTPLLLASFPSLEREAEQRRWQLPWVAVTLYDPLLQVGLRGCV